MNTGLNKNEEKILKGLRSHVDINGLKGLYRAEIRMSHMLAVFINLHYRSRMMYGHYPDAVEASIHELLDAFCFHLDSHGINWQVERFDDMYVVDIL